MVAVHGHFTRWLRGNISANLLHMIVLFWHSFNHLLRLIRVVSRTSVVP